MPQLTRPLPNLRWSWSAGVFGPGAGAARGLRLAYLAVPNFWRIVLDDRLGNPQQASSRLRVTILGWTVCGPASNVGLNL